MAPKESSEMKVEADPTVKSVGFDKTETPAESIPIAINRPPAPAQTAPAIDDDEPPAAPVFHDDDGATQPAPAASSPTPKRGGGKLWAWLVVVLLIILAGLYLAADKGLIRGGSHLPYHIFSKYKASQSTTAASTTSSSVAVPANFSQYKLATAGIEFDAPTAWGTPSFQTDPGFSSRGGNAASTGTHAYLVNFASDQNVQLALTNGSLLPANATANNYYDYLKWCQGTIDQKLYLQRLLYSTANSVDTPSTVSCDFGPLISASQVDSSTIEMTNVKNTSGGLIGNIYVKNLTGNSNVVVLRAVDVNGNHDSDIKTLLGTIQNL